MVSEIFPLFKFIAQHIFSLSCLLGSPCQAGLNSNPHLPLTNPEIQKAYWSISVK